MFGKVVSTSLEYFNWFHWPKEWFIVDLKPKLYVHKIIMWGPEAFLKRWSYKRLFWKYAADLKEITHTEVWFQYSCFATLLKSHFRMGAKFAAYFQHVSGYPVIWTFNLDCVATRKSAFTCLQLTIETLEQGVRYVQR